MLDIKYFRKNSDLIIKNLKNRFQKEKILIVKKIIKLDKFFRKIKNKNDDLKKKKNILNKKIKFLILNKKCVIYIKKKILFLKKKIRLLTFEEKKIYKSIKKNTLNIPNFISNDVPIGKNFKKNIELKKIGNFKKKNFLVPNYLDIIKKFEGINFFSSRKISGSGFYFLKNKIALLHSAILNYARDFMINKKFNFFIPPFLMKSTIFKKILNKEEIKKMIYNIKNKNLSLIGTSEHPIIGYFYDTIFKNNDLPIKLTSYSPCFRKEGGSHGIEERGLFRTHQFEKQEMIVICHPKKSDYYFEKLSNLSIEFFSSLNIPIRILNICSGCLSDMSYKSVDFEAWSPNRKKFLEIGSCSNLIDFQARRYKIRSKFCIKNNSKNINKKYFPHTLNNTVVASPRILISFLENNFQKDGSIKIPKNLRIYFNNFKKIFPKK